MGSSSVRAIGILAAGIALMGVTQRTGAQSASAPATIAIGVGSPRAQADALDVRIGAMLASGVLVRTSDLSDPMDAARRHQYFAQYHRGVPVLGGGISRQVRDGVTISAFGTLYEGIDLDVPPRLSAVQASTELQRVSAAVPLAAGSAPALVVLPQVDGTFRLTYRATFTDGQIRFVDADTGELVRAEDAFVSQNSVGTGQGTFGDTKKVSTTRSGTVYQTIDGLRPAQIVTRSTQGSNVSQAAVFTGAGSVVDDADNVWTNAALVDAHVHAGWTYDYFNQRMNWLGLDGQNSRIDQVVTDRATIPNNAFFSSPSSGNVGIIAYGVSDGNQTFATLDVVGHELMHGVTFFSLRRRTGGGLGNSLWVDSTAPQAISQGQTFRCATTFFTMSDGSRANPVCQNGEFVLVSNHPGAVNEGFSDVFGTAIEARFQAPGNGPLRSDYLQGEDLMPGGAAATAAAGLLRSLVDPASQPIESTGVLRYPDHYSRRARHVVVTQNNTAFLVSWTIVNGQFIALSTDNGSVHFNASLLGHVYYLAVEGGTNRTSGLSVSGVGFANRESVERVFFRAMNLLMPAQPTFPVAALALRQAAIDLYGSGSAQFRAMDGALTAVGL